jgi:hypothetical protein
MLHGRWPLGLLVLGLLLLSTASVRADRVPGQKTVIPPSTGTRTDITVPYLTTGFSTLMPGRVAPRIYSSERVDSPTSTPARQVYNLIFYGSVQAFGNRSEGATPRPTPPLRPAR